MVLLPIASGVVNNGWRNVPKRPQDAVLTTVRALLGRTLVSRKRIVELMTQPVVFGAVGMDSYLGLEAGVRCVLGLGLDTL